MDPPFPTTAQQHPHRDMEIFTYVIDGQLSHMDSMGNKEALSRGAVQYLSAGTGISHSVSSVDDECGRKGGAIQGREHYSASVAGPAPDIP